MKFSLQQMFASIVLMALLAQAYVAYDVSHSVSMLRPMVERQQERIDKIVKPHRHEYELRTRVIENYKYPGDFAAAEQRYTALKAKNVPSPAAVEEDAK